MYIANMLPLEMFCIAIETFSFIFQTKKILYIFRKFENAQKVKKRKKSTVTSNAIYYMEKTTLNILVHTLSDLSN